MHFIHIPSQPFLSGESFLKFLSQAFTFTQYPLHTTNLSLQAFSSLHMPKTAPPPSKNSLILLLAYSTLPICPKHPIHPVLTHFYQVPSSLKHSQILQRKKSPANHLVCSLLSKQVLLFYLSTLKGAHQFRGTLF